MNVRWCKIRSWHAIQQESDAGHFTYCGRAAHGEVVDELPAGGKGCESCLRVVARLMEALGQL